VDGDRESARDAHPSEDHAAKRAQQFWEKPTQVRKKIRGVVRRRSIASVDENWNVIAIDIRE
jgi:hypothetical protein